MSLAVRQVPDPVVGQFSDVRVLERRATLDVDAKHREVLGGHSDNRHIADDDGLNPRLLLRALSVAQLSPHVGEDLANTVRRLRRVLRHVASDLRVFLGFVESADAELERAADRRPDCSIGARFALSSRVANVCFQSFDALGHRHRRRDVVR